MVILETSDLEFGESNRGTLKGTKLTENSQTKLMFMHVSHLMRTQNSALCLVFSSSN